MLAPFLDRLTAEELDAIPYGIIQLDEQGTVRALNRAEAPHHGSGHRPLGRSFFDDLYPRASVPELWDRFTIAVADGRFDDSFPYTFGGGTRPRDVQLRMYYSVRTRSVWLFIAKPDGSPLDRVMPYEPAIIRPTPSHGIDLRVPRVA